jgi:hypothetical protein
MYDNSMRRVAFNKTRARPLSKLGEPSTFFLEVRDAPHREQIHQAEHRYFPLCQSVTNLDKKQS